MTTTPSTFWDEEKGHSEFRWEGLVLTGTNKDTIAAMTRIVALVDRSENLRRSLQRIGNFVQQEELELDPFHVFRGKP